MKSGANGIDVKLFPQALFTFLLLTIDQGLLRH